METILPTKHLSARVPWHDNKWNGTFCCNVLDNSFCRILSRIDAAKDPDSEPDGTHINEDNFPPCIAEKGTFLSPFEYTRPLKHAWNEFNRLYLDYLPGVFHHKPYSFNAIPFSWVMKAKADIGEKELANDRSLYPHRSVKADLYGLDYKPELEQEIDEQLGFDGNTWVQHPHNQQVILNGFFNCLKEKESLVFFYAKHTPLSDPNERIIVGVAKVRKVGPLLDYKFKPGYKGYRSHPWDRCIEHTLTQQSGDGFLMPYHELLAVSENNDIELHDYVAVAPNFEQYSYASELVEHDTAIDSLLNMAEALKKSELVLGQCFKKELAWIDLEISNIWDMRGAFPGMGPVLTAMKLPEGNSIAWEIEKFLKGRDGDLYQTNPWTVFEDSLQDPTDFIGTNGARLFSPTIKVKWRGVPAKKKIYAQLLSRMQLNNDQAYKLYHNFNALIGGFDAVMANPYLLFEKTRYRYNNLITFHQIDKAIFPPTKITDAFPLPAESAMDSYLDERRIRAIAVVILEEAASQGHTLLPIGDMLDRLESKVLDQEFPIDEDILSAYAESPFFNEEVQAVSDDKHQFMKLTRLSEMKTLINDKINRQRITDKHYGISHDWLQLIYEYKDFDLLDEKSESYEAELLARMEKAEALKILVNYRVSVLIGPAGSGKTTLLKIFESLPEIQKGGVLKLAPTGKARVKLGADGKTIAQFLYPERYDAENGVYFTNDEAEKFSGQQNVIIDEASMLTEEQLAAIFDALGPIQRLILVGDYRQLPPIGTGRPFVDITELLRPEKFENEQFKTGPAYAELCQILRQAPVNGIERIDVSLSRCFANEPNKEDLSLFNSLSTAAVNTSHIRLEKWYSSTDFKEVLKRVINEELELDANDLAKDFNRTLGATDIGDYQFYGHNHSETMIEDWQIISPVNGYGFGTKEINKLIQHTYRQHFVDLALSNKKRIAKPKGTDNMVYGDKVINLKNSKWEDWQWINPYDKKDKAYNYFANGEIGIITGNIRKKGQPVRKEENIEIAFSTQPGYSYVFWPTQFNDESRKSYKFELGYAITVHKAQGSGFKLVFFVLPSKGQILSRELMYTALTRQEEKIIILHQGEFRDFIRLAGTESSSTARRFTDLFYLPTIKQLKKKYYDARYINVSERGERMISKNEVIIANCLNKYKRQLHYAYEDKLQLEQSGRVIKPDFTIENKSNGRIFYWEHLGMMSKDSYREKWIKKLAGYLADGFVLYREATRDDDKILIITEENPNGGIDSQYFDNIVKEFILIA